MAYDGLMDDFRTIAALGVPRRAPVCALSEEFDVRWYNRGTYEAIISSPDALAACTIAAVREFDYDWAWLQVDDCIEFEVLGVGCAGGGDILRATCRYLPATRETLDRLKMPDLERDGRMPILLEALRQVRAVLGDTACVTGRVAAPFSSTALLYGIQETMMLIYSDPQLLHDTNDFFVDLQTRWGLAQFQAGAQALWVGDCNAMSHFISLEQYAEFAFPFCRTLLENYRRAGCLSFLHASEENPAYIHKQSQIGADVVSVGPGIDIAAAKDAVRGRCALIGNLDPIHVLQNASPARVASEAARIMHLGRQGGGYIFSTGEMVPRDTPEANMRAMIAAARAAR